jgi:hypothetical protein
MLPDCVPVAVGEKVTLMEQVAFTASVEGLSGQLFVCENCALAAMLVMLSAAVPVLVSVTVCAALVVPTGVPPGAATNVAITDVRASVAEAVSVAVCVPVAEIILSSEKASVADPALGDANVFPYPLPAVHVPDPLFLPK